MKKILLIAYKFPPYSGVGGYRWSKLCKYLARLGYVIHVVTIDWSAAGPNTLSQDVQHQNIRIHRLPLSWWHKFRYWIPKNRIIEKIKSRLFLHIINPLFFFDDEAQHWGLQVVPFCIDLIRKEGISILIATGHPFSCNRFAIEIKEQCDSIKLIQDFRDFWLQNPFRKYTRHQYELAKEWQKISVEKADCVVAISKPLLKLFIDNTNQKSALVIENGYDPSMKKDIEAIVVDASNRSTFVYIGNLYNGRHPRSEIFTP